MIFRRTWAAPSCTGCLRQPRSNSSTNHVSQRCYQDKSSLSQPAIKDRWVAHNSKIVHHQSNRSSGQEALRRFSPVRNTWTRREQVIRWRRITLACTKMILSPISTPLKSARRSAEAVHASPRVRWPTIRAITNTISPQP